MAKYRLLRERLAAAPCAGDFHFELPAPASRAALERAHSPEYVRQVLEGDLPRKIERRIGFPWSEAMVSRSRRSVGATLAAADAALLDGAAVNLAGGTHHAFADRGGGFCVFNDTVVAARSLLHAGRIERALVVDLDVHQGDGTASLCRDDSRIYTFSMHGATNYPARKEESDRDVPLADGTDDETYLAALARHLPEVISAARPDLVFYLAGADPYRQDRYGRLALTKAGLAARDRFVFGTLQAQGLPVAVAMAGGYAPDVEDIVDIHAETVHQARDALRPIESMVT